MASLAKTGRLVVAETSWLAYGVAAEICRIIAEQTLELRLLKKRRHHSQIVRAPVFPVGAGTAPAEL